MGKEKKKKESKVPQAPRKEEHHSSEMHPPHCPDEPDQTLPTRGPINDPNQDVFADTSRAHQDEGESEGEEGTAVAAPAQRNAM